MSEISSQLEQGEQVQDWQLDHRRDAKRAEWKYAEMRPADERRPEFPNLGPLCKLTKTQFPVRIRLRVKRCPARTATIVGDRRSRTSHVLIGEKVIPKILRVYPAVEATTGRISPSDVTTTSAVCTKIGQPYSLSLP